jgi:beta-lactamase regulating signal transducer with metallopeptidase domain
MNELLQWFTADAWRDFTMTLLHTLWLGLVWAFLLWVGLKRVSPERPEWRYGIALMALTGLLFGSAVMWGVLGLETSQPAPATAGAVPRVNPTSEPVAGITAPAAKPATGGPPSFTEQRNDNPVFGRWFPWVALLWAGGSLIMLIRLGMQLVNVHRVRKHGRPVADSAVLGLLEELQAKLGITRRVRSLASESFTVPAVFGVLRPTLLLPASLLTGLAPYQLRAVVAHELAHIRRHDYLINLGQGIVEAILFFNPAVWWISRQIRHEREACCDALAVQTIGEKGAYAEAITDWVAQQQAGSVPAALMPSWGGGKGSGGMVDRLKRLLVPQYRPAVQLPWYSFIGSVLIAALLLAGLYQGTQATVAFAAELLSPAERIQKMTDIEQSHGDTRPEFDADQEMTVSGIVQTEDGRPVPERTRFIIHVEHSSRSSGIYGMDLDAHGRFNRPLKAGSAYLAPKSPGYAPAII